MEPEIMNEIAFPVLLGITSSLVATFIFLVLSWVFKNIVIPWYTDKVYRGVRLNGHWIRSRVGGLETEALDFPLAKMNLKQRGEIVSGFYHHGENNSEKGTKLDNYKVSGHISNSFLTITLTPIENDNIDAVTQILYIYNKNHKLKMSGKALYISSESASVHCLEDIIFEKCGT
jgi:hypothetical protein